MAPPLPPPAEAGDTVNDQQLRALGQLTSSVMHDFKNLLAIILGNAELLEESLPEDEDLLAMLRLIRTAAERGEELAGSLVVAAAPRAGDAPPPQDVAALQRQVEQLLHQTLGGRYGVELGGGADRLERIDGAQLARAILQLCLSSRAALPTGGSLTVRIENKGAGS